MKKIATYVLLAGAILLALLFGMWLQKQYGNPAADRVEPPASPGTAKASQGASPAPLSPAERSADSARPRTAPDAKPAPERTAEGDRRLRDLAARTAAGGLQEKTRGEMAGVVRAGISRAELDKLLGHSDVNVRLLGVQGLAAGGTAADAIGLVRIIGEAKDEDFKRHAVEIAGTIRNPDAAAVLFEVIRVSEDPEMVQMAQKSLAGMPGESVLEETVMRFELSVDERERDQLLGIVRHVSGTNSVDKLGEIADRAEGDYSSPLALAAVDTLGIIGTVPAVSNLFERIESGESAGTQVVDAVSRVSNPEALPFLIHAAAAGGSMTDPSARLAATRALGNYTRAAVGPTLEALLKDESNAAIRAAAEKSLKRVKGEYGTDFSK
ncbi:MAG: hypothetical protein C0404_03475 [Verrucomicrobia bacterium]|nr:hypothetical protein [Verrucomicrobiota bacterium]